MIQFIYFVFMFFEQDFQVVKFTPYFVLDIVGHFVYVFPKSHIKRFPLQSVALLLNEFSFFILLYQFICILCPKLSLSTSSSSPPQSKQCDPYVTQRAHNSCKSCPCNPDKQLQYFACVSCIDVIVGHSNHSQIEQRMAAFWKATLTLIQVSCVQRSPKHHPSNYLSSFVILVHQKML